MSAYSGWWIIEENYVYLKQSAKKKSKSCHFKNKLYGRKKNKTFFKDSKKLN